jgi:hypothetical protein
LGTSPSLSSERERVFDDRVNVSMVWLSVSVVRKPYELFQLVFPSVMKFVSLVNSLRLV